MQQGIQLEDFHTPVAVIFFKNLFRLVLWCPSDVFARTGVEN
jgi:hypothetical protein